MILCNIIAQWNTTLPIATVTKSSILDAVSMSLIWFCFVYTLNRKTTLNFNENRACVALIRQQLRHVANCAKKLCWKLNSVLISASKSFQMLFIILEIPMGIYRGIFRTFHTSKIELFAKSSKLLEALNCFCKKF